MTVRGRFTLDTNILVYAVDRDAGRKHVRAREIVESAARADCILAIQALAEFYHATTRKKLLGRRDAGAFVLDWREVFPLTSADASALIDALDAVEDHGLAFWDALLWATARRAGCAAILTEDMQDGRRLGGVSSIDPFAPESSGRLEALGVRV